jgi:hypothetical protein
MFSRAAVCKGRDLSNGMARPVCFSRVHVNSGISPESNTNGKVHVNTIKWKCNSFFCVGLCHELFKAGIAQPGALRKLLHIYIATQPLRAAVCKRRDLSNVMGLRPGVLFPRPRNSVFVSVGLWHLATC